jgi:uncharacterized membrane protein YhhN
MMMTRLIWWAALTAGATYMLPVLLRWEGPAIIAWKGAGVGLLALWTGLQARERNGWLITIVMAFGALGDVLLDAQGLEIGGAAFALGHLFAIGLYVTNRRVNPSLSQKLLGAVLVPGSLVIVWALLAPAPGWWHAAVYTAIVAVMAATAWRSRFPRYRVGIGAVLFLISDLIIFAGEGGAIAPIARAWLVWPLYYGGQALIAWGVVDTLRQEYST